MNNLELALRFAEAGIAVFPCGPDKRPLLKWRELSSSDPEAVEQWWRRWPDALPGIDMAKAELFALDGDRHGGPDGRKALADVLDQQVDFDRRTAPAAITPGEGLHVYFGTNGHELDNARGALPEGVDCRGFGGYVIAPGTTLPDGRCYQPVRGTPDLATAFQAGELPDVPPGIVALVEARKAGKTQSAPTSDKTVTIREKSYAQAALRGCVEELAAAGRGGRNELANRLAFRMGRMIARGWIDRAEVEEALIEAMQRNGYTDDDGVRSAVATLNSGLNAGEQEPLPDLDDDQPAPTQAEAPEHPKRTLEEVHAVFRRWLGPDYDMDTLDAALAAAASDRLSGDPLWLLIVAGSGNAKTETASSLAGTGAIITSTITSEGGLLSATPKREQAKGATGGLLRRIGNSGTLVIKDFTSILSADRTARAAVLAALREIYDGRWERNCGADGGRTLTWTGRITIVAACTTAWDAAHSVISAMGDRFVLVRARSDRGRVQSGIRAIHNTGEEITMRQELAAAVGGLIGHASTDEHEIDPLDAEQLVQAADIVTRSRTAVERDRHGNVAFPHEAEMPTRFARQLVMVVRGAVAVGMSSSAAMRLAIRCARDSIPPMRLEILLDLAEHGWSRPWDVRKRIQRPRSTVKREMEALYLLNVLRSEEEELTGNDGKLRLSVSYDLVPEFDREMLKAMSKARP